MSSCNNAKSLTVRPKMCPISLKYPLLVNVTIMFQVAYWNVNVFQTSCNVMKSCCYMQMSHTIIYTVNLNCLQAGLL